MDDYDIINWRKYLLDRLYTKKGSDWKFKLYKLITEDSEKDFTNYRIYHLQNKFFIEQFYLLNLPQFNSKKNIHSPILSTLSQVELKNYSKKKIKKNRKKHPQRIEIELK